MATQEGPTPFAGKHPNQEDNERIFPLALGIVSGGLIGAAVALLFTPRSGLDLRSRLARRAPGPLEHMIERTVVAGEQAKEQAERLSLVARRRAEALLRRGAQPEARAPLLRKEGALLAQPKELWQRLRAALREAMAAGKAAAREKAVQERARYRRMSSRPDALSEWEEDQR